MARNKGNGLISTILTAVVASGVTIVASDYVKQHSSSSASLDEKKVEEIVSKFLADNPRTIIEALQNWQITEQANRVKKQQEAVTSLDGVFKKGDGFPIAGNKDGDVHVVEFYDYNCPACKAMFETLDVLLKEDKNVRIVFVEFPIFGPQSDTNAKIALAVYALAPEKFYEWHTGMMRFKGKADEAYAMSVAKSLGISPDALKKEIAKPEYEEMLKKNREYAKQLDIRGTPAVIANGLMFNGVAPYDDLKAQIAFARGSKAPADGAKKDGADAPAAPADAAPADGAPAQE